MQESFDRTIGGIQSVRAFYDVDIICYIEGKKEEKFPEKLFDYKYYEAVLSKVCALDNFKIQVLGSKKALIEKGEKISEHGITNHYVVVDRDHDDFVTSRQQELDGSVFKLTHGYSWENDFWTTEIIRYLLDKINGEEAFIEKCLRKIKRAEKRISIIHKANLVFRMKSLSLFPLNSGSIGCRIDISKNHGIAESDVKRIILKIKTEICTEYFFNTYMGLGNMHAGLSIQGHAFEAFILAIVKDKYLQNKIGNTRAIDLDMMKNICFVEFFKNPRKYLSNNTVAYYENMFVM